MNNIISIQNFSYWNLFDNMSLEIEDNSFVTLSGPNNCGKTTLLRILDRQIITNSNITVLEKDIIEHKIDEYSSLVQCIIPTEYYFEGSTLEEEISLYNPDKKDIEEILKGLGCKRIIKKAFSTMSEKELLLSYLVIALCQKPRILLVDQLSTVLEEQDTIKILKFLKTFQSKHPMTIIYSTINLTESLETDFLYIISEGKICLSGKPLDVLEKDNIINKLGLKLPFMVDLSVKLKDYDLIKEIELDKNRMVDMLWK